MGVRELIRQKLVAYEEKKYKAKLSGKKITYDQWIAGEEQTKRVGKEPRIVLLQTGEGTLATGAEEAIKAFFAKHPEVVIAYGDEDVENPSVGKRSDPWFKPDWSPDTFLSGFYFGSVTAVRRKWLEKNSELTEVGGLTDQIWQLVAAAGGFEKGCKAIGHIPRILFHGVSKAKQEEINAWKVMHDDPVGEGIPVDTGVSCAEESNHSMISIIIPSKDHPDILFQCLAALFKTKGDCKCEVIVVDNGSLEENRLKIEDFLQNAPTPCKYIYRPMEFNFSRMCNLGAQEAEGEFLLFLNDDVEAVCPGWLAQMVHKAVLPYVGAVGLKLYYPGGKQIQHIGIVNLPEGPIHKLQFMTDDRDVYGFNTRDRNVLAVTGACLMVQKEKYRRAGGMKEGLRVTFNDVDLCFQLWEQGYHNVVLNSIYAYHHESLSRGEDSSGEKAARLKEEQEKLYAFHPKLKGMDPYYSPGFNRDVWDAAIRPIFVTAGNRMQEAGFQEITVDLNRCRRDDCLLFSLQKCGDDCIQGYSVVLGDNNACYDRRLILCRLEQQDMHKPEPVGEPQGKIRCVSITLEGQYRPDLEENMTDQVNVALCGFWVKADRIPEGVYRMGILADSRVSGIRLVNWSKTLYVKR